MRFLHAIVVLIGIISTSTAYRDLDWYECMLQYQIYPRSFKDSDGDGIGDLRGIVEKLDYLVDLGVDAIWIQPFYQSPMRDLGYDVSDYRSPDPMFGSMTDLENLIKAVKERGLKLVIDFVPNHSSDEHEWFKLSQEGMAPYKDYYVWADGRIINESYTDVPNNWISLFEGSSAWAWNEKRRQYYYHVFSIKQPDLNYRNTALREEINNILRFWLELGVDGFRIDAPGWLMEAPHFRDEPLNPDGDKGFMALNHVYTMFQEENFDLIHEWRMVLEEFKNKDGHTRLLSVEDFSVPQFKAKYMGNSTYLMAQMPFNFMFEFKDYEENATNINDSIQSYLRTLPASGVPNWASESHDYTRIPTRFGAESVDAWNMLHLLLPGILNVYYGMELGLEDSFIRQDQRQDHIGRTQFDTTTRDTSRTPMPWDNTKNGGFTIAKKPWLPIHSNYVYKNVKSQLEDPESHLNTFKRLVKLRKTNVIRHGRFDTYVLSTWVFMYTRTLESETIAVIINLGTETEQICTNDVAQSLPAIMTVHTSSRNSDYKIGDEVTLSSTIGRPCSELRPKSGLVLSNSNANTYSRGCSILSSCAINLVVFVTGMSLSTRIIHSII
ncbi:unnamed protein product [Bemisia tabaci]|uniref:alpha-glucosidase n=2 Tax=Bemisia tabaci TaxID=7038 RepID=A0A9P0AB29_BEMTA|nr:unnamed protein product [Bemisia tabaci]